MINITWKGSVKHGKNTYNKATIFHIKNHDITYTTIISQLRYIYIYMLNKNTPGEKKSEAKSEAPVSSYSYMRLKSVISG